ncbi:MAG TPA: energy transducer TonB [Pyrinomonadaceae bacterium]|jgi:TonB family protein
MKRVFVLFIFCAFASVCAADALAQSRRVRRSEPPQEERAGKSETKEEAKDGAQDQPQDGAQADDEPQTVRGVTKRAVIKSKPNPGYPVEARGYGVRGVVKLRIILGSDGKVRDKIKVIEGLPHGVTEEAIKAARRIKFEPAEKEGRPVSQYVIVIYHFNLY